MGTLRARLFHKALRVAGYCDGNMDTNGERRLLAGLPLGRGTVLDVGANVGQWATVLLSMHRGAQIYCFEPSPEAFVELQRNMEGKAVLHNLAASDNSEERLLFADVPGSGLGSFYERRLPGGAQTSATQVRAVRIDAFCAEQGIDHVDLLKIDSEGHELAILRGASGILDRVDAIQFEYGGTALDARIYLRDFFDLLGDRFDLYRLWRRGKIHYRQWTELLEFAAYQNWVAIRRPE